MIVVLTIEGFVCTVALWRGLYRRLPFFAIYLTAVVVCDILRFEVTMARGPASMQEFITYWATQLILMLLRAGVIYELCRQILSPYPGVWKLCVIVLVATAIVLITVAMTSAMHQGPYVARLFLKMDRGFELGVLGVLVTAMSFCRYYRIPVDRLTGLVALGLSLYSSIDIISNTFAGHWFHSFQPVWREVRGDSFLLAEIVWLVALWKPLPHSRSGPPLLDARVYSEVTTAVNIRLRELNTRLEEIQK